MRAIVVGPHPDDETLGAGGTILRLISEGHEAFWLNVTNMKEEYGYSTQIIQTRAEEIKSVVERTGYKTFFDLGLKPAGLEGYERAEIILKIKEVFETVRPELVFLPYPYDVHSDHRVVFECALACTKSFRAPYVRKVVCMEILSETDYGTAPFHPNCFVNIDRQIEKKADIAMLYKSEFKEPPFPRSREAMIAQSRFRGAACCQKYAEAFHIIKERII